MKKCILLILVLLLFSSCNSKKDETEQSESQQIEEVEEILEVKVNEEIEEEPIDEDPLGVYKISRYFGTIYLTKLSEGPITVYKKPTVESAVITELENNQKIAVSGISDSPDIDGFYWFRIREYEKKDWTSLDLGWISGKHLHDLSGITPLELEFIEFKDSTDSYREQIKIRIEEYTASIVPSKVESQDFYVFTWSDDHKNFNYACVPGIYIWYPDTEIFERITYVAPDTVESAWVLLTDDFQYMLQDVGTAPGPRYVGVTNLLTDEKVFEGSYFRDINLIGYEIDIVYIYDDRSVQKGRIDEESIAYAEAFLETTTLEESEKMMLERVIVKYRYNFKDNTRVFLGCEKIPTF